MDKSTIVEHVRRFADKAREMLPVRQVILFGSYAKGTAGELSDIDVAVITDTPVEDWLAAEGKLFRLRRSIDLDIEPVLIDWTDDWTGFLAEIRRTGEVIYDRDAPAA